LIEDIEFDALLGDKAFDNDWLRAALDQRGTSFERYKWRHLVENLFGNSPRAFPRSCAYWNLKPAPLKQWRRTAPRTDKTARSFAAKINLSAAIITLK
jgi:transposase